MPPIRVEAEVWLNDSPTTGVAVTLTLVKVSKEIEVVGTGYVAVFVLLKVGRVV